MLDDSDLEVTKSERREKRRRNARKHRVSGRSLFTIERLLRERREKEGGEASR